MTLELSLLQEQKLSQIQIQTLTFLTMSNSELEQYVEKKAEENPLINIKAKSAIYESEHVSTAAQQKSDDWDKFYQSLGDKRQSLGDVLSEQLHLQELSALERRIGDIIIHSLDENGFLSIDRDALLEKIDDENKIKVYYKMCDLISSLEPVGCACDGVYQSLKRQFIISNSPLGDDDMLTLNLINQEDFEHFSQGKLNYLAKKHETDKDKIQKAFSTIKTLNPYPGLSYNIGYDKYIEPDIIIKDSEGGLSVEVESTIVCEIDENSIGGGAKEDKKAISALKNEAMSLIALLDLRRESVGKIAAFIINAQSEYIKGKSKTKKALSLKDIADATALSLSTVSRIVNCHWAEYNGKSFILRSLMEQKSVQDNTQDYVADKIKEIISASEKKLSDEKISKLLDKKYGIKIARRTVQKYRAKLNISSSYLR